MFRQKVNHRFVYNDRPSVDYNAAYNLEVVDNYTLLKNLGTANFQYSYFDYLTGSYVSAVTSIDDVDFVSLSEHLLVNKDDTDLGIKVDDIGRTNEVEDTEGWLKGRYYKRLNALVSIWIDVDGNSIVFPGDLLSLVFAGSALGDNIFTYQFSGYWLVKRVIQSFTDIHRTKLLLVRPGVDTDKNTTLRRARFVKKEGNG
jgi:hypothetical protein